MTKAIFFLLTAIFISGAFASRSEVRVAEKSTVRVGDPIRLGVLLKGEIQDSELEAKLQNLVVFDAQTDEGEKKYQSEDLALTLRQKLSFQDLQRISIKIPDQFVIQARRNFLYVGDMRRDIIAQALTRCLGCTIVIEDLNLPELKVKGEILQMRLETQALRGAGGFLLPLVVETSQGKSTLWVNGKLSFFKMAPVAKRLLRPNERISSADFEMRKVDVSFARDGVPTAETIVGKVAAKMLVAGQPIFVGDLKPEAATQRGQVIKVLVGNDSFEIATTGTAEEAGSIGDVIKVKSHDTKKLLSGVLIDKGVVRVE